MRAQLWGVKNYLLGRKIGDIVTVQRAGTVEWGLIKISLLPMNKYSNSRYRGFNVGSAKLQVY